MLYTDSLTKASPHNYNYSLMHVNNMHYVNPTFIKFTLSLLFIDACS